MGKDYRLKKRGFIQSRIFYLFITLTLWLTGCIEPSPFYKPAEKDSNPAYKSTVSLSTSTQVITSELNADIFVTINISPASSVPITVGYVTSDNTTTSWSDYVPTVGSVTIPAGYSFYTVTIPLLDDNLYELDEDFTFSITSVSGGLLGSPFIQSITISGNDSIYKPEINFTDVAVSLTEADTTITATVTLDRASGIDTNVALTYSGVATGGGVDFTATSTLITFLAGEITQSFTIDVYNDALTESDETVIISINSTDYVTLGSDATKTITIIDNQTRPALTITATNVIDESDSNTYVATVTLAAPFALDITASISLTLSDATLINDYTLSSQNIFILAGDTTATFSFAVVNDTLDEDDEDIVFLLSNYHPLTDTGASTLSATTQIVDDDSAPTVSFNSTSQSVGEANSTISTYLSLDATSGKTITVPITLAATSTATYGASEDHLFSNTSIVFNPGEVSKTVTFAQYDDAIYETDEDIILYIGAPTNATIGINASHSITITDNETAPVLSFSISHTSTYENSLDEYVLTANLSRESELTVSASLDFTGTAIDGTDFQFQTTDLIFSPGSTTQDVTFTMVDDDGYELSETIIINATDLINATLGTTQTFTILNDDPMPDLTISATDMIQEDDVTTYDVTITLSSTSYLDTSFNITLSGTATATVDYALATTSFTISAGANTTTTSLVLIDDTTYEGNESIIMTISGASYATNGASHTLTIIENDSMPTLSVSSPATTGEASGSFDLLLTLSASTQLNVSADLSMLGSANNPLDYYFSPTSPSVNITAGSTTQTITVYVVNDSNYETSENIQFTLSNLQNASEGTTQSLTSIVDNDVIPTLSITTTASMSESGGTYDVVVSSNVLSYQTVSATLSASGTATANHDFILNSTAVSIAPGSNTATLSLSVINDSTDEPQETLELSLSGVTNANFSATSYSTIEDNDNPPTINVSQVSSIIESVTAIMPITLTLSATSALTITGSLALSGTAISSTDYNMGTQTFTIAAGSLTASSTFQIINDSLDEDNETIIVNTASLSNVTAGTGYTTTVIDDDAIPTVSISGDNAVTESVGTYNLTVTLNATSGKTVSGQLNSSGTATNLTDYSLNKTTFSISAGTLTDTVTVTIVSDTTDEDNETIIITPTSITNATPSATNNSITTVITDDDPVPNIAFSAASLEFPESAGDVSVTFVLDRLSSKAVSANFAITGTATTTDHDGVNGTITIPAGSISANYSFNILEDYITEDNETIIFTLSSPTNGALGTPNPLTVTITDNDTSKLALGAHHTCILISGQVKCWGNNQYGQLGFDTVSLGFGSSYGDNPSESVTTSITSLFDYLDLGTGFIATSLVAGGHHTCAINSDSEVKCWGDNRYGQLGFQDIDWGPATSIDMGNNLPFVYVDNGNKLKAVKLALGERHTCALNDEGEVFCFGANNSGQLGNNSIENIGDDEDVSSIPVSLPRAAVDLSCGAYHTCAVLDDNTTTCWGNGFYGQLGDDNNLPIVTTASTSITWSPPTLGSVDFISSGGFFNCLHFSNNFLKCFGFNSNGELGLGDNDHRGDSAGEMAALDTIDMPGSGTFQKITSGLYHTCLLRGETPYCYGDNQYGQLGINSTTDHNRASTASIVNGLSGLVKDIDAGYYHTCALLDTKTIKCWGANSSGQLGAMDYDNKGTSTLSPNRVEDAPVLILP